MKLYKYAVIIVCISVLISISKANAQEYSEFKNKKICHIPITLDIPNIDVPAFLWSVFDFDPIPEYRNSILEHYMSWYPSYMASITNPEERKRRHNALVESAWSDEFNPISGDCVYQYRKAEGVDNWYNTSKEGDYWFVTKSILYKNEPMCWVIPLKIQPGTQIDLALTQNNAIYLSDLFDEVVAEAPPPKRHGLYSDMIDVLYRAKTLYYKTDVTWKAKDFESHYVYKVWLKKPNFARIELYRDSVMQGTDEELYGIMVGDGENFWFFWKKQRPYMSSDDSVSYEKTRYNSYLRLDAHPGFHSIWHVINRTGGGMIVFQPSLFHKCHNAFDENIDSVIVYENEVVGDEMCNYIEVSYLDHQRSHYYWLGENDTLPRRCKDVVRIEHESVIEETWSDIVLNGEMPDSLFAWIPPEGWAELVEPSLATRLLPKGTPAPDFSFETVDGDEFTLSECKGKVVLINFWRVGCPPCRDEIPWLEEMHQKYKDQGLIIVGYNTCDDIQYIQELLDEHNVTYPNIYTTCDEAQTVQFEQYQKRGASGVPLNYVIDKTGNVACAWYGWDQSKERKIVQLLDK